MEIFPFTLVLIILTRVSDMDRLIRIHSKENRVVVSGSVKLLHRTSSFKVNMVEACSEPVRYKLCKDTEYVILQRFKLTWTFSEYINRRHCIGFTKLGMNTLLRKINLLMDGLDFIKLAEYHLFWTAKVNKADFELPTIFSHKSWQWHILHYMIVTESNLQSANTEITI